MRKVGIGGGTGYTGVEVLRLLAGHPNAELVAITSRSEKGKPVSELFTTHRAIVDSADSEPTVANLKQYGVVFSATADELDQNLVPAILSAGIRSTPISDVARILDIAN